MTLFLIALLVISILVGFVVLFGPPYLPTKQRQIKAALEMLDLKPGQTVLDLGSGDGRVLIAAARLGLKAAGIELSPVMFLVSWLRTRPYRSQVSLVWGNYFSTKWPKADAIYCFLLPRQMSRLDRRINLWRRNKPVRLASFAFKVPDKQPTAFKNGVYLYYYK